MTANGAFTIDQISGACPGEIRWYGTIITDVDYVSQEVNGCSKMTIKGKGTEVHSPVTWVIDSTAGTLRLEVDTSINAATTMKGCDGTETTVSTPVQWGPPILLYRMSSGDGIQIPASGLTLTGKLHLMWNHSATWDKQPAEGDVTYKLSPTSGPPLPPPPPPGPPKKVEHPCSKGGCDIAVQNQSVGESVGITGTPFSLRYQSDQVADRADANSLVVSQAAGLGGWTLNINHGYDPSGGGLFLGDGGWRSAKNLGAVKQVTTTLPGFSVGDFIIPAEDGSEVYIFDQTGKHLRILQSAK